MSNLSDAPTEVKGERFRVVQLGGVVVCARWRNGEYVITSMTDWSMSGALLYWGGIGIGNEANQRRYILQPGRGDVLGDDPGIYDSIEAGLAMVSRAEG